MLDLRQYGCAFPCQIVAADVAPSGGGLLLKTYKEVRAPPGRYKTRLTELIGRLYLPMSRKSAH
eukprot:1190541-Prorocentrum_minimum.AAC.4